MSQCKYCCEQLEEEAKKCKVCGEPFYLTGKILKFVPLFSVAIAVVSLAIAFIEIQEKQKATRRAGRVGLGPPINNGGAKPHPTISKPLIYHPISLKFLGENLGSHLKY